MNLVKAFSAVSGLTLASRVTGLLREILAATWFGAGMQMDAFQRRVSRAEHAAQAVRRRRVQPGFRPVLAELRARQTRP
jgi:putative peptidoglycan lipid II flippase